MLSIKEIQTLQPKNEKYNKGCRCSNGLTLEISSIKQGGTKCFVGRRLLYENQIYKKSVSV